MCLILYETRYYIIFSYCQCTYYEKVTIIYCITQICTSFKQVDLFLQLLGKRNYSIFFLQYKSTLMEC